MIALKAIGIKKSFFDPKQIDVIQNISLTVERGESVAICGRSGEGKTTLLHILGTLESCDSGEIEIAQNKVTRFNAHQLRQQHIGFIFQSYNLLEDFTVIENILMPARIARIPAHRESPIFQKALQRLEEMGLSDRMGSKVKFLSGGERQRVAIARALCNDPTIILADEPTGNLDRENANNVGQLLIQTVKTLNKCLILVTHDRTLARLCDRELHLQDGKIL